MKRITWEKPNGEWGVEGASISNAPLPIYNALERLLDYERLGLDPDELARIDKMYAEKCRELAEYKRLEEQGLILRVSCFIGSIVWVVGNYFINDYEVKRYIVDEAGIDCIQIAKEIDGKDYWNSFSIADIGKIVFLTKEEAEQALKQMGE